MPIQYTNIFHCKTLQNVAKLKIFGLKINHLASLIGNRVLSAVKCNARIQGLFLKPFGGFLEGVFGRDSLQIKAFQGIHIYVHTIQLYLCTYMYILY
jgi:hypothetical protein